MEWQRKYGNISATRQAWIELLVMDMTVTSWPWIEKTEKPPCWYPKVERNNEIIVEGEGIVKERGKGRQLIDRANSIREGKATIELMFAVL